MKRIWFHGTSGTKAKSIQKSGYFDKGTWFAKHLEDALAFGGLHVFWVLLDFGESKDWQVLCGNKVSQENIIKLQIYKRPRSVWFNRKLWDNW